MSRPLLYFLPKDFEVVQNERGNNELQLKIEEPTLVLFYNETCSFCKVFLHDYRKLTRRANINIAMCNVNDVRGFTQVGRKIVSIQSMSENTTTPIEFVPLFLFYNRRVPLIQYEGERTLSSIYKFTEDMLDEVRGSTTQRRHGTRMEKKNKEKGPDKPESYTVGRPMSDDVCYLTMDEAYGGEGGGKGTGAVGGKYMSYSSAYGEES